MFIVLIETVHILTDRHLQLPNIEEARAGGHYKSLNRPKVKPVFVQPNGDHVYQTSHGELNTDTREKFSNAWLWTTTNKATYKDWIPVIKVRCQPNELYHGRI